MSTILKALEKSQQERNRGTVPTLGRAPRPAPPLRRPTWPWWVGGGVALNAATLAAAVWWLSASLGPREMAGGAVFAPPEQAPLATAASAIAANSAQDLARVVDRVETDVPSAPPTPEAPAAVELAEAPMETAGADGRRAEPVPETASTQAASIQAASTQAASIQAASIQAAPAVPPSERSEIQVALAGGAGISPPRESTEEARTEIKHPAPTAASALGRALREPTPAPTPAPTVEALPDLPPPVEVPRAVVAPPQPPVSESEPEAEPYATLPALFHLPTSIQTAIPELPITVHVFDQNAGSRFVIIQRRKYREGDRLSDNLTLESIAPGGLVLRYQDTAFRVDL